MAKRKSKNSDAAIFTASPHISLQKDTHYREIKIKFPVSVWLADYGHKSFVAKCEVVQAFNEIIFQNIFRVFRCR